MWYRLTAPLLNTTSRTFGSNCLNKFVAGCQSFRPMSDEKKIERPEGMGSRKKSKDFAKDKGPIGWVNLVATGVVFGATIAGYLYVRNKKLVEREKERKREIGKAKIGGTFQLTNQSGEPMGSKDFLGKWVLLYFGFSHCPDICPDEMEKMAEVYDLMRDARKSDKRIGEVVPVFITVDPERDRVDVVKEYVKEFHPDMIGLTGTPEEILAACKGFRVYFSAGPKDEENDYIVDHTIIIYLLDPEGQFVDYYGQRKTAKQISESIKFQMAKFIPLR